jgi:chaperonin GroEL (HSP60 family)
VNLESQARLQESQAGDATKAFIVLAAALLATSVCFSFSAGLFTA